MCSYKSWVLHIWSINDRVQKLQYWLYPWGRFWQWVCEFSLIPLTTSLSMKICLPLPKENCCWPLPCSHVFFEINPGNIFASRSSWLISQIRLLERTPGFYISLLLLAPWVEKRAKQRCRMSRSRGKRKEEESEAGTRSAWGLEATWPVGFRKRSIRPQSQFAWTSVMMYHKLSDLWRPGLASHSCKRWEH